MASMLVFCAAYVAQHMQKATPVAATNTDTIPNLTPADEQSAYNRFSAMLKPGDPNSILTMFDAIQASDNSIKYNCHELSHALGHRAYDLYGFADAMTFSNPNRPQHAAIEDICNSGFMHGVLEDTFLHNPDNAKDPDLLCANVPLQSRWSCFHGIGHGLMFIYDRKIAPSLQGCRNLADTKYSFPCFQGVWMELFLGNTEHAGLNTLYWDLGNPLGACLAAPSDAKHACYIYVSLGYLRGHPGDYPGTVTLCTTSHLTSTDEAGCLESAGLSMLSGFKGSNLEQSEAYVKGLNPDEKKAFYRGLTAYALISGVPEAELTRVCSVLVTDSKVCSDALTQESNAVITNQTIF